MDEITYTPDEFAAEFPKANGHIAALRYVAIHTHPRHIVRASDIAVRDGEAAVEVGYTNKSRSKKIVRFAIVSASSLEVA